MINDNYAAKLRDPRWQKKRLEIMNRDEWCCQLCFDDESTLVVHHRLYLPNKEPWEYPDELLITLCEDCHNRETDYIDIACGYVVDSLKRHFLSNDIERLAEGIFYLEPLHQADVVADAYARAFTDKDIQRFLVGIILSELGKQANKNTSRRLNNAQR
jgi:hypothetical protein